MGEMSEVSIAILNGRDVRGFNCNTVVNPSLKGIPLILAAFSSVHISRIIPPTKFMAQKKAHEELSNGVLNDYPIPYKDMDETLKTYYFGLYLPTHL